MLGLQWRLTRMPFHCTFFDNCKNMEKYEWNADKANTLLFWVVFWCVLHLILFTKQPYFCFFIVLWWCLCSFMSTKQPYIWNLKKIGGFFECISDIVFFSLQPVLCKKTQNPIWKSECNPAPCWILLCTNVYSVK